MAAARLLLWLLLALLGSCTAFRATWHPPQRLPSDSLTIPAPAKVKAHVVNITYQLGNNNNATPTATDNRQAGKKGNAATGDGSTATSTRPAGTAWYWFALVFGLGAAGGAWLRGRLKFPFF